MAECRSKKCKAILIVVCPETGRRLCYDNKWREFANFGTYKECVKEFKYLTSALKAGKRYRLKPAKVNETISSVIHMYAGDSMDASGEVRRNYE